MTAVQLTRLTIAFGAVSDLWFVILLARAADPPRGVVSELPLAGALLAGAVVAVGLFAYGASLNDILDHRHDATFSPQRPIPAGRINLVQAVVVAVGTLITAVLAAAVLGTWSTFITLLVAAGVLFWNATGKFIPAVGAVTIGLVHAAHMFIPDQGLDFTWPVWLVMTHATAVAAVVHVLEDKRPRFTPRAIAAVVAGWLCWSLVLLWLGRERSGHWWPEGVSPGLALIPAAAVVTFVFVARWKTKGVPPRIGAEKVQRYAAMWQSLYGAAWLLVLGLTAEAIWIGLFALVGFAAMTLIKEITGQTHRPLGFRAA